MNKSRFSSVAIALLLFSVFAASDARAVAFRTFIASTGSDANTATNCGRTTPCQHLNSAYSVTSPAGEIVALDSAGVGGVTITTAVTITSLPGEYSFINVPAATAGITINAGTNDLVVLRNLQVSGANAASTTGVQLNTGNLLIENCSFSELTTGVFSFRKADIVDSNFHGNTTAVRADGEGADTQSGIYLATQTSVRISNGNYIGNGTAFVIANPGLRTCPSCGGSKANLFVRLLGNSSADYSVNIAGNTNAVTGTGVGCPTVNDCTQPTGYSGVTNPR